MTAKITKTYDISPSERYVCAFQLASLKLQFCPSYTAVVGSVIGKCSCPTGQQFARSRRKEKELSPNPNISLHLTKLV